MGWDQDGDRIGGGGVVMEVHSLVHTQLRVTAQSQTYPDNENTLLRYSRSRIFVHLRRDAGWSDMLMGVDADSLYTLCLRSAWRA